MSNIFEVIKAVECGKQQMVAAGVTEEILEEFDDGRYLMRYVESKIGVLGRKSDGTIVDIFGNQAGAPQSDEEVIE